MVLSGQQRKELLNALIQAFPDIQSLDLMLSLELDKHLRTIAGEGSLQDIVFKLIQTANAEGWIEDLVRAARRRNPNNVSLQKFEEILNSHEKANNIVPPKEKIHTNNQPPTSLESPNLIQELKNQYFVLGLNTLEMQVTIISIISIFISWQLQHDKESIYLNYFLLGILIYYLIKIFSYNYRKHSNFKIKRELKEKFIRKMFNELNEKFKEVYSISVFVREDWVLNTKPKSPDCLVMDFFYSPKAVFSQEFIESFKPYFGQEPNINGVRGLAGYVLYKEQIKTIRIKDVSKAASVESKDYKAQLNFLNFQAVDDLEKWQIPFNFTIHTPIKSVINGQKIGTLCVDFSMSDVMNSSLYLDEESDADTDNFKQQSSIFKNLAEKTAFIIEMNRIK